MTEERYFPGLEGVIAGETSISTIAGGLQYRGYSIEDLARESTFEEVAYLLLEGQLPTEKQLADFRSELAANAAVPDAVLRFLAEVPGNVPAMDVLRSGISAVAHFDPELGDNSHAANVRKSRRLIAKVPTLIGARHRLRHARKPLEPKDELSLAGNLLWLITGDEPIALHERAMDVSLVLYAEHEFNASTFTARVVASTLSDVYSAVTAAVGALKGPLHGGANERVMEVLQRVGTPEKAETWVSSALERKERVMGFGHRVYKTGDPRAAILKDYCRQLAQELGDMKLEEIAEKIESVVRAEKGLPPNLDWPSARLYFYMGLETDLYTPLFVAARVAGWCAHVMEQLEHNRLIRPRARYIGPAARKYTPLERR